MEAGLAQGTASETKNQRNAWDFKELNPTVPNRCKEFPQTISKEILHGNSR
jgi:hypothetical protein